MKRTPRGFALYGRMRDSQQQVIRVQESSAIGPARAWLFCDLNGNGKQPEQGQGYCTPYLSKSQAKRLATHLLRFAEEP